MTSEPSDDRSLMFPGAGLSEARQVRVRARKSAPSVYRGLLHSWMVFKMVTIPGTLLVSGGCALILEYLVGWMLVSSGLFAAVLMPALSFPCRYTIMPDRLVIRRGLKVETLPLARIRSVFPAEDVSNAPGAMSRRVRVNLTKGHRIISPERRMEFIRELKERAFLESGRHG